MAERPRPALSYGVAISAVGLTSLATDALWNWLESSPSLLFFPAIIAVTQYGGLGAGLFATGLSSASLAFFFLPPYFSLTVQPADGVRLAVFAGTTLMVAGLTSARRRAEAQYRQLSEELERRVRDRTAELEATTRALETQIAQRVRLEEQMAQAQRLEAVGLLAGGIAHDFNNLLTIIIGSAEMLAAGPEDDADVLIAAIQKAAARAATLTRQLLAYSRRQILQPQLFSLNALVEDGLPLFERLLPYAISIRADLAPDLPQVYADPGQVEQIVMNLVVNAMDAMPEGGTLTVSTAAKHLTPDDVRDDFELEPGFYVRLAVSDTGIGMDRATAARAFEPFFTTKPIGKGTGLGLSSVYGIVKQSDGLITLETAVGGGTTVSIYFPVSAASG